MGYSVDTNTDTSSTTLRVLQALNTMINNNIVICFILSIIVTVLLFGLYYFTTSLIKTLNNYYSHRTVVSNSNSDNVKDKSADNEIYPETIDPNSPDDDVDLSSAIDPRTYMPKTKREFLTKLKSENMEYNQDKTEFMTRRLNYDVNDDIVDDNILYKEHDNYTY